MKYQKSFNKIMRYSNCVKNYRIILNINKKMEIIILPFVLTITTWFYVQRMLPWQEKRQDLTLLSDRLLDAWPLYDTGYIVNGIQHFLYIFYFRQIVMQELIPSTPLLLTWILLIWTRMIMLYLCPFKVHPKVKILKDPIHDIVIEKNKTFIHDLFFSGHVSSTVIMGLTTTVYSEIYFIAGFLISLAMLWSKIHYTIDIIVAPYVAFGSYELAKKITESLNNS